MTRRYIASMNPFNADLSKAQTFARLESANMSENEVMIGLESANRQFLEEQ